MLFFLFSLPLQPTHLPSALDKSGKKEEVEKEVQKEEHFIAYPGKSPSRVRPLDHLTQAKPRADI